MGIVLSKFGWAGRKRRILTHSTKFWNSFPARLKKRGQKRPVFMFIQLMTKAGGVCSSGEINTMMHHVRLSPVLLNDTKHELSLNWKIKLLLPDSCQ